MSPAIKCFENPMKLREIKCQRILTSTKVAELAEEEPVGFELFVSNIPQDADEDELIPFFEQIGPLHTFRLMMDFDRPTNRGHAYITYIYERDAKDAASYLNGKEIRKGQCISISRSFNNCRIFIGGIPVNKTKDEVWHELQKQGVPNIMDVIMYRSYSNRNFNRGFVFVEFPSHKFAAKMRLKLKGLKLFGYEVVVDWSVPQPVVTDEEMSQVKIIYVRNLDVTESREEFKTLIEQFIMPSAVEKVYKFKDYAFIHLSTRDIALKLMDCLKEHYKNTYVEVTLAKPRNHFTKPGYRKYQMMKNTPYLPKSYTKPPTSTTSSLNMNFHQTPPPSYGSTQSWIQSLPTSPACSPSPFNPCDVFQWDKNEQYFDEEPGNSIFHINLPMAYHIQNGLRNLQLRNERMDLENYNLTMNNLKICCARECYWNNVLNKYY